MNGVLDINLITIIFIFFLFLAGLGCLYYYLKVNILNPTGRGAGKSTARILKKFGLIRGFKIMSDVTLSLDGKTVVIENILIGCFGILLVHTCGMRGEYYGTLDGKNWTVSTEEGRKKHTIINPMSELSQAQSLLRTLFSKNQVYSIPIETVVYMSNRSPKFNTYITNNGEILMPGKLPGYLRKAKFEKDIGLDIAKISTLIEEHNAASRNK